MMTTKLTKSAMTCLLCGAALGAIAVSTASAQQTVSDEIVVTAQRQEQSLTDVPISITAFGSGDLQDKQIEGFTDVQFATPNLNFSKSQFTGSVLTIRGITNLAVASTSSASVSIHQNDIPQTSSRLFETEFFDIDRIEVLRGPQGTLFGRNATGGVLNIHTKRASLDEFGGNLEVQYGNFQSFKTVGALNVPLGDRLAARVAGTYISRDGLTENIFTGNSIDDRDIFALRGSVHWEPTDNTTVDISASYFEEDDRRTSFQATRCNSDPILGCATGLIGQPGGPTELGFDQSSVTGTISTIASTASFAAIGGLIDPALAPLFSSAALFPTGTDFNATQDLMQPSNPREVELDVDPEYFADELFISFNAKHDFERFSIRVNGGYGSTAVDSFRDTFGGVGATFTLPNFNTIPTVALALVGGNPALLPPGAAATQTGLAGFFANGLPTSNIGEGGVLTGDVFGFSNNLFGIEQSVGDSQYYSVEGIVSTDFDGPLNFLGGVNFLRNDSEAGADFNVSLNTLDYFSIVTGTLLAQTLAAAQAAADPTGLTQNDLLALSGAPFSFFTPTFNNDALNSELRSISVFGEVYYDITDTISFTGGVRYNNDRISTLERNGFISSFTNFISPAPDPTIPPVLPVGTPLADLLTLLDPEPGVPGTGGAADFTPSSLSFGALSGRAVLQWQPIDGQNYYVSWSRGFKPGGVNPAGVVAAGGPENFDQEIVNAYEIGAKLVGLDNRLRANLTGFYYDYGGLQLPSSLGLSVLNSNVDVRIFGVEGEFLYSPTDDLRFNLTASYLNSSIQGFATADTANPAGFRDDVDIFRDIISASSCAVDNNGLPSLIGVDLDPVTPGLQGLASNFIPLCASTLPGVLALVNGTLPAGAPQYELAADQFGNITPGFAVDLDGNELPLSPDWSIAIGAEYDFRVGDSLVLTPRLDYFRQGGFFSSQFNRVADRVDGYGNLNMQMTIRPEEGSWYARIFAQNVLDSDNVQGQIINGFAQGNSVNQFLQEPRRFGGAIGVNF